MCVARLHVGSGRLLLSLLSDQEAQHTAEAEAEEKLRLDAEAEAHAAAVRRDSKLQQHEASTVLEEVALRNSALAEAEAAAERRESGLILHICLEYPPPLACLKS